MADHFPPWREWERLPQRVEKELANHTICSGASKREITGSLDSWARTRRCGRGRPDGSDRVLAPYSRWHRWRKVWNGSSKVHKEQRSDGTLADRRGPRTYGRSDCHGGSFVGGVVGKASRWPTITLPRLTNLNWWSPQDCLGQPEPASDGNPRIWPSCGRSLCSTSSRNVTRSQSHAATQRSDDTLLCRTPPI